MHFRRHRAGTASWLQVPSGRAVSWHCNLNRPFERGFGLPLPLIQDAKLFHLIENERIRRDTVREKYIRANCAVSPDDGFSAHDCRARINRYVVLDRWVPPKAPERLSA